MSFRDHMVRKLSRSLCDKPDLNRRALQLRKCFAEADRILNCGDGKICKKKDKS